MSDSALRAIKDLAAAADGEALYRLGLAHFGAQEYKLAAEAYRAADALGYEFAIGQLAKTLDVSGNLVEAEAMYQEAIRRGDTLALLDFADMILVDPSRHQEAEGLLRRAISADMPSAQFVLGKLLSRQPGRESEAEAAFRAETNVRVKPLAQRELSHLLSRLPGREDDAERANLDSLSDDALAEVLYRRGQYDEAVVALRRAAEVGSYGAWNNLTVMLKSVGRLDDAEAAYQDGIRAGETDLFVHYGNFLVELGQVTQGEVVLRQGLQFDARCAYVLGAILLPQPGREEEAREWLIWAAASGVVAAALYLGQG